MSDVHMPHPGSRGSAPSGAPVPRRRPRLRGVPVGLDALDDPPTSLDESFEILRHPELFRLLRARAEEPAADA